MAVRDREFFDTITPRDRLRYRIRTDQGKVVDFVVQYETMIDGDFRPVVRYDASHGRGHKDVLGRNEDTIHKEWLPEYFDTKEALRYEARDLRDNWKRYRHEYLERTK